MPVTSLQNMSDKGNRIIKPRTVKNDYVPRLLHQLKIQIARDSRDIYPLVPFGYQLKGEIMNTDEILQRWLDSEIPEAYIYE